MMATLIARLRQGCKLISLPKFTPESYLGSLLEHKATILNVVPPMVIFMANYDNVTKEHVKYVRIIVSGAAPLGVKDVEQFRLKAPNAKFSQGYGLTETSSIALLQYLGSENYGSVGAPTPVTQAKIIPLDGSSFEGQGPNVTGELLIRGPQVMKGYYKNPKATVETIVDGGWLRTGDVAYYDEKEQFYITDRFKELIKVKGFQVAPAEMEEVIRSHPAVAEAAVVGVPHDRYGEVPKAFIALKENKKVTSDEIKNFVAGKVAEFKRLRGGVEFIKEIPKTATGKILRKDLRSKVAQ